MLCARAACWSAPATPPPAKSRPTGLYLFFGFLLVSCVLLVLVMNGVI